MDFDDAELTLMRAFNARRADGVDIVALWNASCDRATKGDAKVQDEHGKWITFKCPQCGKRYVDSAAGHEHEAEHA